MLDNYEEQQCPICFHLKCTGCGDAKHCETAPIPDAVADLQVNEDLDAWMKTGQLKKIAETGRRVLVRRNLMKSNNCSGTAVDAFFKSFKSPHNSGALRINTRMSGTITEPYGTKKKQDYSYF